MLGTHELPATLRAKFGLSYRYDILLPLSAELDVELWRCNHLLLTEIIIIVCISVTHSSCTLIGCISLYFSDLCPNWCSHSDLAVHAVIWVVLGTINIEVRDVDGWCLILLIVETTLHHVRPILQGYFAAITANEATMRTSKFLSIGLGCPFDVLALESGSIDDASSGCRCPRVMLQS